ncbi:MAG: pyridoxamine 5'-phosphate oxidase family protein [Planctomycetia bacterium]|nr:pyridoxamine 5'-phosphate oxidase family protein [Planctomycetia bacterium]
MPSLILRAEWLAERALGFANEPFATSSIGIEKRGYTMVIREMDRTACLKVLAGAKLARLACAHENQPYIVPTHLAYHEASESLYGFTTRGRKVDWMRANPLVCVEFDEVVAYDQWVSVIVIGVYEELPAALETETMRLRAPEHPRNVVAVTAAAEPRQPTFDDGRREAWTALNTLPMWWQPGSDVWTTRPGQDPTTSLEPIYYRIKIKSITGHTAAGDARPSSSQAVSNPNHRIAHWLRRIFSG